MFRIAKGTSLISSVTSLFQAAIKSTYPGIAVSSVNTMVFILFSYK